VPRLDPRLPKLDFDPNKPYVSKSAIAETISEKPSATRPQKPVAALLGGFGKK
jgi:ATP-dependent RNA helicase RhlE